MFIFRTYFKILKKYKATVILYTVILLAFAGFNMQTSDQSMSFTASRPDVAVVNEDKEGELADLLTEYIREHANIKEIAEGNSEKEDEEALSDGLFYRDVNYIIYIPENFSEEFSQGKRPAVSVRSTGDYQASYMEMQLERFLKVAGIYQRAGFEGDQLEVQIKDTLSKKAEVEITSTLDTESLSRASFFYNFANYSLLAGCVYVVAVILSSFRGPHIKRRTDVSPMKYTKLNGQLLLANGAFALVLWAFYVIISMILIRDAMFTVQGLCYILNSFVFAFCALSIGFLIGNLTIRKEALSAIVNVVALGSSFLCGSFVPVEFLPDGVLKAAHLLPSYWYIQNNELIGKLETVDFTSVKPLLLNGLVVIGFTAAFVIVTNVVSRRTRVIRA